VVDLEIFRGREKVLCGKVALGRTLFSQVFYHYKTLHEHVPYNVYYSYLLITVNSVQVKDQKKSKNFEFWAWTWRKNSIAPLPPPQAQDNVIIVTNAFLLLPHSTVL